MASANKQLASPNWAAVSDWLLRVIPTDKKEDVNMR